jgi:hypothetical protein
MWPFQSKQVNNKGSQEVLESSSDEQPSQQDLDQDSGAVAGSQLEHSQQDLQATQGHIDSETTALEAAAASLLKTRELLEDLSKATSQNPEAPSLSESSSAVVAAATEASALSIAALTAAMDKTVAAQSESRAAAAAAEASRVTAEARAAVAHEQTAQARAEAAAVKAKCIDLAKRVEHADAAMSTRVAAAESAVHDIQAAKDACELQLEQERAHAANAVTAATTAEAECAALRHELVALHEGVHSTEAQHHGGSHNSVKHVKTVAKLAKAQHDLAFAKEVRLPPKRQCSQQLVLPQASPPVVAAHVVMHTLYIVRA